MPAENIECRHRAVQDALRFFVFEHLPHGTPRKVSSCCATLAGDMLHLVPDDDPELTRGLNRLLEAKDALVRAAVAAAREAGQASS